MLALCHGGRAYFSYFNGITKINLQFSRKPEMSWIIIKTQSKIPRSPV